MKLLQIRTAILLSVALAITTSALCQEKKKSGFASVNAGILLDKDFTNKVNLNAGISFFLGDYLSAGPAFDLYIFKDPKFVVAKADFRIYPVKNDKEVSPFVGLVPGYVLYNQNNTKGAAAIDLLAGVMARPVKGKGLGLSLAAGYSKFGFKYKNAATTYTDAFKIQFGLLF